MVHATRVAQLAERLLEIFSEAGVQGPVPYKGVMQGALSIWEVLRTLKNSEDFAEPHVQVRYVASAGIHDLSAKIVAVWDQYPHARDQLIPHLKLLARSYHVGQNSSNRRWKAVDGIRQDFGDADKVIELYWACLCILIGANVTLDDPDHSSGGKNPDVLATMADDRVWAFALKTLTGTDAENVPKNLANLIASGCDQIRKASCDRGVVVVNFKNVLQHDALRLQSYSNFNEAAAAVADQLDAIRKIFWDRDAALLPTDFAEDPKVSPIAIMVAHAMVLCVPEGRDKLSPTEIKVKKVMTLPNQFDPKTHPRTSDVWKMAECLNCKVAYVV